MKKIKPIVRIPGSKFRMIYKIFKKFDFPENAEFKFYEPFGGTMIVGANVLKNYEYSIVFTNDFDKFWDYKSNSFRKDKLILNQQSFGGLGKNVTQAAIRQFNTKVKNGYWDRVDQWNSLMTKLNVTVFQNDWKVFQRLVELAPSTTASLPIFMYVDPPYYGAKYEKLYENKVNHTELFNWLNEIRNRDHIKILISLNDTPEIREIFKSWNIEEIHITYTFSPIYQIRRTKELFISNF